MRVTIFAADFVRIEEFLTTNSHEFGYPWQPQRVRIVGSGLLHYAAMVHRLGQSPFPPSELGGGVLLDWPEIVFAGIATESDCGYRHANASTITNSLLAG